MCIISPFVNVSIDTPWQISEKNSSRLLTPKEARAKLEEQGLSIARWSKSNGLNPNTVSDLLNGRKKGIRGESHNAAVLLGLKHGKIANHKEFATAIGA
ncbi:hypothetical protein GO013_15715 [Pseudodesulfovibrio sp. JC047]|uniref:DNA-binding protein n=1 Tax=Pseudodesulfovibrio sp. JC047 TaxID=2683199 RepID=UPI0013D3A6B5|nr:DNA-binding protein [Pseudodesulfovibrio sp. JC047]NDV20858.1 hypothetical protein [Pseudodesulfovibrio sp. JC047]